MHDDTTRGPLQPAQVFERALSTGRSVGAAGGLASDDRALLPQTSRDHRLGRHPDSVLIDREPDAVLTAPTPQIAANISFFFTYDSPAVRRYRADVAALRASPTRIVLAVGSSAPKSAPCQAAAALAAALGSAPVEFPGGHTAWLLRPKGFATKLRELMD